MVRICCSHHSIPLLLLPSLLQASSHNLPSGPFTGYVNPESIMTCIPILRTHCVPIESSEDGLPHLTGCPGHGWTSLCLEQRQWHEKTDVVIVGSHIPTTHRPWDPGQYTSPWEPQFLICKMRIIITISLNVCEHQRSMDCLMCIQVLQEWFLNVKLY